MRNAMVNKIVSLIFQMVVCCPVTTAKELYEITFIGKTCQILDPTIVANYTCKSKNVNRTTNIASVEIVFQPGVILTNYHAKIQLYRKFATIYRPFMVSLDQDLCAIYKEENLPVVKALNVKRHRKYGNVYDPCPISGRRYESLPVEYEGLPDILPSGEYRFNITLYSYIDGKKRNIARAIQMGELKTTTAEQWRK